MSLQKLRFYRPTTTHYPFTFSCCSACNIHNPAIKYFKHQSRGVDSNGRNYYPPPPLFAGIVSRPYGFSWSAQKAGSVLRRNIKKPRGCYRETKPRGIVPCTEKEFIIQKVYFIRCRRKAPAHKNGRQHFLQSKGSRMQSFI